MTNDAVKLLLKRISGILREIYTLSPEIIGLLLVAGMIGCFVWVCVVGSAANRTATWIDNMHPPSKGELYGLDWSVIDIGNRSVRNAYRYHIHVYNGDGVLLLDRRCILWRRTAKHYANFIKHSISDATRIERKVSAVKETVNTSLSKPKQ